MGLGVEGHGLVLHLQALCDEPVDGVEAEPFPAVIELAAVDGRLSVEQEGREVMAWVLARIWFSGDEVIELRQHIANIQSLEGAPAAFFVAVSVVVDLKVRWVGDI
jgi:hypothetical protein